MTWKQVNGGSVRKLKTGTLNHVLLELKSLLGDSTEAEEIYRLVHAAYTENDLYEKASSALVNAIFGKYGLVTLNMSHKRLKQFFKPIIEKELFEQPSQAIIEKTQQALEFVNQWIELCKTGVSDQQELNKLCRVTTADTDNTVIRNQTRIHVFKCAIYNNVYFAKKDVPHAKIKHYKSKLRHLWPGENIL